MSTLKMPKVDRQTLKNKDKIIKDISNFTKNENILAEREELKPYETDGLTAYKQTPMLVVLPENTEEVSKILSYCNKNNFDESWIIGGQKLYETAMKTYDIDEIYVTEIYEDFDCDTHH